MGALGPEQTLNQGASHLTGSKQMQRVGELVMRNITARLKMITAETMLSLGKNIQSCSQKSRLTVLRVLRRMFTAAAPTASMTQSLEVGEEENHQEERMVPRVKDLGRKVGAVTNPAHQGVAHQVKGPEGETTNTRQKLPKGKFLGRRGRITLIIHCLV